MSAIDFAAVREFVYAQRSIGEHSVHGSEHWAHVEFNGLLLAKMNGADEDVVRLFALFHDSRRVNDWYDEKHGPNGAALARKMRGTLFQLDDARFDWLYRACAEHTTAQSTGIVTVDTCFDADRLDLVRIGIMPDPVRMATPEGAAIARLARREGIAPQGFRAWLKGLDVSNLRIGY